MRSLMLIVGRIKKTPPVNSREVNHLKEGFRDDKRRSTRLISASPWAPVPATSRGHLCVYFHYGPLTRSHPRDDSCR
jgi:hypothetical protein